MVRVAVADDCALTVKGLRTLFEEGREFRFAGHAGTETELLTLLACRASRILVLDPEFTVETGPLTLLQRLADMYPHISILVYTHNSDEAMAVRALRIGARGYVLKKSTTEELLVALRKVGSRETYMTPSIAEKLALLHVAKTANGSSLEQLSDRELQVFYGLALGKRLVRIAQELSLSAKTVTSYRARVVEKLGVCSNADIVRLALTYCPQIFNARALTNGNSVQEALSNRRL
jgi:DNA-binding NarL/FixJ family response regulator